MINSFAPTPFAWQLRALVAATIAIVQACLVAWQWAHGGIVSHHLLANPDLPAISNAWGILALPALAWFATGRFLRRATSPQARRSIGCAAVGAMGAGALLSLAFTYGSPDHATLVMLLILLSGVLLPLYRAEYLLGFVLAMNWVFGPILPMMVGAVVVVSSYLVRRVMWPTLVWATSRLRT